MSTRPQYYVKNTNLTMGLEPRTSACEASVTGYFELLDRWKNHIYAVSVAQNYFSLHLELYTVHLNNFAPHRICTNKIFL